MPRPRPALTRTDAAAGRIRIFDLIGPAAAAAFGPVPLLWAVVFAMNASRLSEIRVEELLVLALVWPVLVWGFVAVGAGLVFALTRIGWGGLLPVAAVAFVGAQATFMASTADPSFLFCEPVAALRNGGPVVVARCGGWWDPVLGVLFPGLLGVLSAAMGWATLALTQPEAVARRRPPTSSR